jgi:hypothetical protein
MMPVPSGLQLAENESFTGPVGQISTIEWSATETFLIAMSARNPTHRPSGDQKGIVAPSVPTISCGWSRDRS